MTSMAFNLLVRDHQIAYCVVSSPPCLMTRLFAILGRLEMQSGLEHIDLAAFVTSMRLAKELARDQLRSAHWACVSVWVRSLARSRMCMDCGTIDVQGMNKGCARVALDVHGGCAEGSELLRDAQDMRTATNTVGL